MTADGWCLDVFLALEEESLDLDHLPTSWSVRSMRYWSAGAKPLDLHGLKFWNTSLQLVSKDPCQLSLCQSHLHNLPRSLSASLSRCFCCFFVSAFDIVVSGYFGHAIIAIDFCSEPRSGGCECHASRLKVVRTSLPTVPETDTSNFLLGTLSVFLIAFFFHARACFAKYFLGMFTVDECKHTRDVFLRALIFWGLALEKCKHTYTYIHQRP